MTLDWAFFIVIFHLIEDYMAYMRKDSNSNTLCFFSLSLSLSCCVIYSNQANRVKVSVVEFYLYARI